MEIREKERYLFLNLYTETIREAYVTRIWQEGDFTEIKTTRNHIELSTDFYRRNSKASPNYINVGLYTYLVKYDRRDAFMAIRDIYKKKIERIRTNFSHPSVIEKGNMTIYKKLIDKLKDFHGTL